MRTHVHSAILLLNLHSENKKMKDFECKIHKTILIGTPSTHTHTHTHNVTVFFTEMVIPKSDLSGRTDSLDMKSDNKCVCVCVCVCVVCLLMTKQHFFIPASGVMTGHTHTVCLWCCV